jgi:hypothetical protein
MPHDPFIQIQCIEGPGARDFDAAFAEERPRPIVFNDWLSRENQSTNEFLIFKKAGGKN